ncbi:MAG: hypothetical protein AAFP19_21220 [Bacteroidota bacterium]
MNSVKVKFLKRSSNAVMLELVDSQKVLEIPRGVFEKRVELGKYDLVNPSELATVI